MPKKVLPPDCFALRWGNFEISVSGRLAIVALIVIAALATAIKLAGAL